MDYKEKITAAVMVLVAVAMVLGCADTQSFQLSGTVVPSDATVTLYVGSNPGVVVDHADGSWSAVVPSGSSYYVTFEKTGYITQTLPATGTNTMAASLDLGTVTLSIQSTN